MIIVTGATGFIGSAMIWYLNTLGESQILACDTVAPEARPDVLKNLKYTRFVQKDRLFEFLNSPEAKSHVRAIVHMGACSSTTELNVEFLTENNFEYTRKLWLWCTENRRTLIYASSGAVYGDGKNGFDDATPTSQFTPLNPYGESKAAFDRYVEKVVAEKGQTPPAWFGLRFFNVYGPNEYLKGDMSSVVFKAYQQITSRPDGRLKLFRSHHPDYKDGEQLRDFVYVKDIVRWMHELLVLAQKSTSNPQPMPTASGIYNMGFGKARTWLDLAQCCFDSVNRPLAVDFIDVPIDMRPRYQYFTEAKMDRLFKLGLSRPEWDLKRGVTDYIQNHLMQRSAWLKS